MRRLPMDSKLAASLIYLKNRGMPRCRVAHAEGSMQRLDKRC